MTTINPLLPSLASGASGSLGNLQLKLESPLPALSGSQSLTATVSKSGLNGQLLLTLPDGEQITATANPPLATGTRLTFTAAEEASPATPTPTPAQPSANIPLTLRITLPGGTTLPEITLTPQPATGGTLLQAAAPATILPASPVATTNSTPALPALTLIAANISTPSTANSLQITPQTQQIIQQGPLEYSLTQQNTPQITIIQPSTLILQSPTSGQLSTGGQTLSITLPTPLPAALGQPLPVVLVPNGNNPPNPVLLLTQNIPLASAEVTTQQPLQPPQLSALKAILNPDQPVPVPLNTPIAARVLAAQGNQQPLLLATGHRAVLQSPQPLTVGSVIVVEFPVVTGPAQVVKVQSGGGQQTPQPQTQAAPPSATATPAAPALPPGTQVQGLISGQTAQGQPLLTIQAPSQFAGQTLPINLPPEAQHHLPVGTQLTIKVEAGGTASVLSLTLPAAAQRAETLTHLGLQWPGLRQALGLLETQAPQVAQALRSHLPQLQALLPGLLTFVDALRRNNPELALGREAHTLLKSMGVDLTSDVSQLSQLQQRQDDTQWRGTLFPYIENAGDDPRQGGFFWRREKKDDARSRASTRFIMQLSLSNMGEVQLDGLVNYPEIWLKLRRTTPPEEGFITQLQTLVNGTLAQYGLSGGITVETAATFPLNPLAEVLAATPNPLPTTA